MKKLAVIITSVCFFINIIGYHIIFYFRQQGIKEQMRMAIRLQSKSEEETDFAFSLNDKKGLMQLDWDGDDEFSYNGEMYDVIEKKVESSKLIIRALADKKETELVNNSNHNWKENERSNKTANELFQILQTLYHNSTSTEFVCIKPPRYKFYYLLTTLPSPLKKIPTPPPQFTV
ncbi:MAG TPA: hypothetical protein VGG71_16290 [Chitinophagaceae bacterium]